MSVRASLESIFSHLFTEPEEGSAEEGSDSRPPAKAEAAAAAAAAAAEPEPEPELEPEAEVPAEVETQQLDPVLHYAGVPYLERVAEIDDELEQRLVGAKYANSHLAFQRDRAAKKDAAVILAQDFEFGREQRKTGLPPAGSQLGLDVSVLEQHGLLHPRGILTRVQKDRSARSCESPGTIDIMAEEATSRPLPHYMQITGAHAHQMQSKAAVIGNVRGLRQLRERNRCEAEEEERRQIVSQMLAEGLDPAVVASATAKVVKERPKPKEAMSMDQMELEAKVMRRVQAPLDFLRNPRFVRGPRAAGKDAASMPPDVPRPGALIFCKPERVNFVDYEVGGVYEIAVQLCNTSDISCRVRVLPPASPFFSISLLSYPAEHGCIAPGLNAEVRVRFSPDSLADYDDFIMVQTEVGSFPLPLLARRTPPCLTLPHVLDCGYCFVGGDGACDFGAQNTGGAARFFIVERAAWDAGEREAVPVLRSSAFELTPTFLDLRPGDHFRLHVKYAPRAEGPQQAELLLVCDNCQIRELTLVGTACVASVQIESVDGIPPVFTSADANSAQARTLCRACTPATRTLPMHMHGPLHSMRPPSPPNHRGQPRPTGTHRSTGPPPPHPTTTPSAPRHIASFTIMLDPRGHGAVHAHSSPQAMDGGGGQREKEGGEGCTLASTLIEQQQPTAMQEHIGLTQPEIHRAAARLA